MDPLQVNEDHHGEHPDGNSMRKNSLASSRSSRDSVNDVEEKVATTNSTVRKLGLNANPAKTKRTIAAALPRKIQPPNPLKKPAEKFRDTHNGLGVDLDDVEDFIEPLLAENLREVSTVNLERFMQQSNGVKQQLEKWLVEHKIVEDKISSELRKRGHIGDQ